MNQNDGNGNGNPKGGSAAGARARRTDDCPILLDRTNDPRLGAWTRMWLDHIERDLFIDDIMIEPAPTIDGIMDQGIWPEPSEETTPCCLLDLTDDPGLCSWTRLSLDRVEQDLIIDGYVDAGYLIDTREKSPPD